MWVDFAYAKATHIFSAKICLYTIFNDYSINDTLTNDIVSFEQVGPGSKTVFGAYMDCACSHRYKNVHCSPINVWSLVDVKM